MPFSRTQPAHPSGPGLDAALRSIGARIGPAAPVEPTADIALTLVAAVERALPRDYRTVGVLLAWLAEHEARVNVPRLGRMLRRGSTQPLVRAFWSAVGTWLKARAGARSSACCLIACLGAGCQQSNDPAPPVAAQTARETPADSAPAAQTAQTMGCVDDAVGAVRVLGPMHCEVPKAVAWGDNQCLLSRPQLSPVAVEGRVIGFRHDSIPSRSMYALCGIRSGDIWTKLNGTPLESPEAALELYPRLRGSDRLSIQLLRGSATLTVEVELR